MEREDAVRAVRDAVVEVLAVAPERVTEATRFTEDLEADSLDLLEIAVMVGDTLGVAIPDDDLDGLTTVGQAVDLVLTRTRGAG